MFSTKLVSKLGEGRRRPFILVLALLASFLVLLALNGRDNVKDVLSKGGSWRKPKETSKLRLKSLCPSHLKSLGNSSLGVCIGSQWYRLHVIAYLAISSKKSLS